ncbi:MAG TPA: ATP-binding protein [Candidatus Angelobacter sp.]
MANANSSWILLVDDSKQNRYIISRILQSANLAVEECITGREALEYVQRQPDLVILDVKLPDISGYEVCRRIKANRATAAIPVLQISAAFVSNESKVMALEGGADSYLSHPIDPPVLLATVKSLLRLKYAETVLRQTARQWQSTFDSLSEGLVLVDTQNQITRCNRAFAALYGGEPHEILDLPATAVLEKVAGTAEFLDPELENRYRAELQHNGRSFQITVDPVFSGEQRTGSIVVLADITERKMAEESLRNSEKLAATGRLAHTIAHEINNPLEALTNLIYLAQHSAQKPEVRDYLSLAQKELQRVSRITKQVLSFHREASSPVTVDLHELLNTVLSLYATQMESKQIKVCYDEALAPKIKGLPGELQQVLSNLLGNAIDATPANGSIRVRLRPASYNGVAGVRLTVHDTGTGIRAAIRQKIFEPFFTTKELKGSGLGLWLSRNIILKHQGTLRFRSSVRPGRSGTSFSIFLPGQFSHPIRLHEDVRTIA